VGFNSQQKMVKHNYAFLRILVCFCLVLTLGLSFAYAQHPKVTDTVATRQLNTVFIQGVKNNTLASAVLVQVLGEAELKRLSSLSVADALRYFSGIQLKDYGGVGGLKTVNVRSLGTNHTSIFYNGLQIASAQNGQVDLGKYSLENLEEIALYTGQNTNALLPAKAYASSSSIYLNTKTPHFKNDKSIAAQLGVKTGSFALINPVGVFNYKLNAKASVGLSGEVIQSHGKYKYRYTNGYYDTTVVRTNGDLFAKRLESYVQHQFKAQEKLQFHFYHYSSSRGLPGAIVANKFDFTQRLRDNNHFVQANYENLNHDRYQFAINAKYANDFSRYTDPDYKTIDGILDNQYRQHEYYISTSHKYQFLKNANASLSADYFVQDLSANLYNFAYPTRQTLLIALSSGYYTKNLKIEGNVLATQLADRVKFNEASAGKTALTPSVMLTYLPFKNQNFAFRALYKSSFRLPTFNDLYYTFVGNVKLHPEYTKQYNVGFTWQTSANPENRFEVQTDLYYNKVKDKIVAIPTLNLFRWTMVNLGLVDIKGVDVKISKAFTFNDVLLQVKGNYAYEKAIDITPNGTAFKHRIPYTPTHSASFRIAVDYKQWGFNYSYIYTGSRYSQKANTIANYVPAWFTHDLQFQRTLSINKVPFKFGLEVNNVLNQHYDVILNYPMPGRNFRLSINTYIN
jgi:vitamin B12 transporter